MPKQKVREDEDAQLIEVPEGMDPKAAASALDEFLKGDENDGVTSPHQVTIEETNKAVEKVRKAIEKLVKPKWDASECSRLLDCGEINDRPSLKDIKSALIPYVRKGWFATITMPDTKRRDMMLTYEADLEFVTTRKWGNEEQNRDIYVRLYPREPVKVPYISKIFDPTKLFGPLGLALAVGGTVAVSWLISPFLAFAGIAVIGVIAFLMATYAGTYISQASKSKAKKILGPLIFIDDVRGYKTTHKTVTRAERIQDVLDNRILEREEEW